MNDDTGSSNHSNPEMAVDRAGTVVVSWNDRRVDPNDLCFRATVAASIDGGMTFLSSVPIEPTATCALGAAPARPLELGGFTGRYLQGGETQGLAPTGDGRFLAVYIGGGRVMQLRSAIIEIDRGGR